MEGNISRMKLPKEKHCTMHWKSWRHLCVRILNRFVPINGIYQIKGVGDVITGRIEQGILRPKI